MPFTNLATARDTPLLVDAIVVKRGDRDGEDNIVSLQTNSSDDDALPQDDDGDDGDGGGDDGDGVSLLLRTIISLSLATLFGDAMTQINKTRNNRKVKGGMEASVFA
jgi:hypothetical protein